MPQKALNTTSPSQQHPAKPLKNKGFRFLKDQRDKMGTKIKHGHYKPAKIHRGSKWFVYYSYRNADGQFQRFKVYEGINQIKDLKEKEEFAETLRKAVDLALAGTFNPFTTPDFKPVKTWTLVQGLNYFKQNLPKRGLRLRTVQSYESVLRCMYEGLQPLLQTEINKITKQNIASFLRTTAEKKGWSNATYNNNLTFIRSIFNYLIEAEILEINPAKVKPLTESIKRHKAFDDDTWKKIQTEADPELLDFMLFLYHTGTRPNEARQIKYEYIDHERKLLRIPSELSKNKKDDYVPLTDYVLTKYVKKEGFIFGTSVNYFTKKFHELKVKLRLDKDHTLYSTKHTRGIHLAQDGASPYAIMQLFRHSSLEITQKYLRDLGLTINREAADKVR